MKNILNHSFNFEEDEIPTPKKLRMRFNLDKEGKLKDSWDDPWEPKHHNEKFWTYCKKIDCLLEKSIGKPYGDVYSKVCKEYPEMYDWGYSLRDHFKKQFAPPRYRRYTWEQYYVDENGLIQFTKFEKYKKRRPAIKIVDNTRQPFYEVHKEEFQNYTDLLNQIYYTAGADRYYRLIESDTIPEKLYNEILGRLPFDGNYREQFRNVVRYMVWKFVWEKGERGYKKIWSETEDAKKKRQRENEMLREQQKDGLIQYIEWQRKSKEQQNDLITRDRHGFDDESFKGEFYHGQKRKKKAA